MKITNRERRMVACTVWEAESVEIMNALLTTAVTDMMADVRERFGNGWADVAHEFAISVYPIRGAAHTCNHGGHAQPCKACMA